jgi:hypothetical protein
VSYLRKREKEFLEIQIFFKASFLSKEVLSSSKETLSKVLSLLHLRLKSTKNEALSD